MFILKLHLKKFGHFVNRFATTEEAIAEVAALKTKFGIEHVTCVTVETLAERDVKGLYKRALTGEIPHFTGVSDPYEPPSDPEIAVDSSRESIEESAGKILAYLREQGRIAVER